MLAAIMIWAVDGVTAHAQSSREYQLKAVFLFRFTQFVEWPQSAFAKPESPIIIGILGVDPFGSSLDEAVRNERVRNRELQVRRFERVEDIQTCHILFISPSEGRRLDSIFAHLKGKSILTVGDTEGFSRRGGMIRFISDQNRVRFRVNVEAAKAAGLVLSSKLLRWADTAFGNGPRNYETEGRANSPADYSGHYADQQHGAPAGVDGVY